MTELTQEYLKSRLRYEPDTGNFYWVNHRWPKRNGQRAGTMQPIGYVIIWLDGATHYAHRLAWFYFYGVWPASIDHIKHDRDDNRIKSLRDVTVAENAKNYKRRNDGRMIGVYWCGLAERWKAHICANGKKFNLGSFFCELDAISARKSAELTHGFHANHGA